MNAKQELPLDYDKVIGQKTEKRKVSLHVHPWKYNRDIFYHRGVLMFSIEGQELPDAHFETSGIYIFQPNIHSVIRLCVTYVPSWHKHEWSSRKILQCG